MDEKAAAAATADPEQVTVKVVTPAKTAAAAASYQGVRFFTIYNISLVPYGTLEN